MPLKNLHLPSPQVRQPLGELPAYNVEAEQDSLIDHQPSIVKYVEVTPYPSERLQTRNELIKMARSYIDNWD